MTMLAIEHFDKLTEKGMKIIPLRENSKQPMYAKWNVNWSKDKARKRLEKKPNANIGILLGDIIDVEGDSEEANNTILKLIGDYPHPSYKSLRSIHHLFLTPESDLRIFKVGEIEFRGHGHQSVIPPSSHYGFQYKWLRNFKFPIPEMPKALLDFYNLHKYGDGKKERKRGHIKVWCGKCHKSLFINEKRHKLEVKAFRMHDSLWECNKCRCLDVRPICRMIKAGVSKNKIIINAIQQF